MYLFAFALQRIQRCKVIRPGYIVLVVSTMKDFT
jgi:hypothetical protein